MTPPRFDTMPTRMRGRPVDHRGFPVPWFVTRKTPEGHWDFVNIEASRQQEAARKRLCWVSGEPLGKHAAFVIGPMCLINRIAADPPAIPELATWSAQVCPFLSRPLAKRPDAPPEGHITPGIMAPENPGLCVVWTTRDFTYRRDRLFHIGHEGSASWWHKGAPCPPDVAHRLFYAGAERLRGIAEREGADSVAYFEELLGAAIQYLPPEG